MELPALLSLLLATDNPFSQDSKQDHADLILDCHIAGCASSSFYRLKLFAFLKHDGMKELWWSPRIGDSKVVQAVSPLLSPVFLLVLEHISFQRTPVPFFSYRLGLQLFVIPHSFRRWHQCKKFPAAWAASHHHPFRSHLWSCACGGIPFILFLQVSIRL